MCNDPPIFQKKVFFGMKRTGIRKIKNREPRIKTPHGTPNNIKKTPRFHSVQKKPGTENLARHAATACRARFSVPGFLKALGRRAPLRMEFRTSGGARQLRG